MVANKNSRVGKKLTCSYCDYKWTYQGKMFVASCPSCNNKVRVKEIDKEGS